MVAIRLAILFIVLPAINLLAQVQDSITLEEDSLNIKQSNITNIIGSSGDSIDTKISDLPFILSTIEQDSIAEVIEQSQVETQETSDTTIHLLKPPNTDSPRATLSHFVNSMNRSYRLVNKGYTLSKKEPGWKLSEEVKALGDQAEYLLERSIYCLDLSDIPESIRDNLGNDMAFRLKEILDRVDLPAWDEVPGYEEIKEDLENSKYPALLKWTIPNTDIVIMRIQEGEREGQYLFSSKTILHLPEFYNKVVQLPYKEDKFVSRDYYKFYITTPGHLIPPKWSSSLPLSSFKMYFGHTVYQWFVFVLVIIVALVIVKLLYILLVRRFKESSSGIKAWARVLYLILVVVIIEGLHYLNQLVNLTNDFFIMYIMLFETLGWVVAAVLVFNLIQAISTTVITSAKIEKIGIETTYTRALISMAAIISAAGVLIFGLSRVGVSLVPVLTGLGIGGLAIALAARSTIENIIASFTLFAEKLYKVGDRIKILGYIGIIEGIGIRSTQIRTLQGSLVSIPNEKMVTVEIENIQKRPYIRREFNVIIPFDSTNEAVKKSIEIIQDILAVHESAEGETDPNERINHPDFPPKIYFNKFNTDSLNIYVSYWFLPADIWKAMTHDEWINLQIFERFNAAKIDFAFPTQTIRMSDNKLKEKKS